MQSHDTPEKSYDLERLVFFSDGVFAIAITLLVIEMHPPQGWDGTWNSLLQAILAKLVFFVISFFSLGLFWMAHRFVFRHVQKFNELASFLNLLFLCLACLMPFVNALTSEYGLHSVVFACYLGLMASLSATLGLMWAYVSMIGKLTDPRLSTGFKWMSLMRISLSPLVIGGTSLWLGYRFGVWPSLAFMVLGSIVSNRFRVKMYREEAEAPKASDAPK